jgi:hypothetical protein
MPQQSEALTTTQAPNLDAILRRGSFDLRDVRGMLDGMTPDERLHSVRALSGKAQAQLFDAARGFAQRTLEDLVPQSVPPMQEVPHHGKNSLLMFTQFAKVFVRPSVNAQELWGYNRNSAFIETWVGPGYYVAYEADGEVMVDYTRLPEGPPPAHWPRILSNHARLSRFVYANMVDALRAVSSHVSIGRAIRNGKVADNWFVLCRSM